LRTLKDLIHFHGQLFYFGYWNEGSFLRAGSFRFSSLLRLKSETQDFLSLFINKLQEIE